MTARNAKIVLVPVITLMLAAIPSSADQPDVVPGGAAESAPMSLDELQALVAPIALYPDQLVAEILAAATFPDQIAVANYWLEQNKARTGASLMEAVNRQSWNDSVKALTQFPTVLDNMAKNLNWVSTLGEAYHNQRSEVMAAVQKLRAQAKAHGTLKSGPQITVSQESPNVISIEPTDQSVVQVPQYNPSTIYGVPYFTPGYTPAEVAAGSLLGFGAGVAVGALAGYGGWGWGSWSPDWNAGTVAFNHNDFYGNPAWHGGYFNDAYHHSYGYRNAWERAAANRGSANRLESHELAHKHMPDSWARADHAFRRSNAFSGFDDRFREDRSHGFGGWQHRAESLRGWGSLHAGGFRGGRFGGGRFGGGRFRGGGSRRR